MTKQSARIERGYFHHDGIVREATSAEKLLWEEIERLRAELRNATCYCGPADLDPSAHADWCEYRGAVTP